LRLGPTASLDLQRATTDGLAFGTDRTRALWMLGAEAGFRVFLSRRWFVETAASFDVLVPGISGTLLVDEREVLMPSALTLGGAVAFGYTWQK